MNGGHKLEVKIIRTIRLVQGGWRLSLGSPVASHFLHGSHQRSVVHRQQLQPSISEGGVSEDIVRDIMIFTCNAVQSS